MAWLPAAIEQPVSLHGSRALAFPHQQIEISRVDTRLRFWFIRFDGRDGSQHWLWRDSVDEAHYRLCLTEIARER
ncbi:hypothetical protein [Vibrio sp.]|uniref:hypothetical protein n=1 Tax=Vibrio sp. TaxID=678 RepID=UPI003D124942